MYYKYGFCRRYKRNTYVKAWGGAQGKSAHFAEIFLRKCTGVSHCMCKAHFSVSRYENSFPFRLARLISWHFTLWAMSNSCGHAEVGSYAEKSRTFLTECEAKFSAPGKNINFVRIWANGRNIAGWYFLHNQKRERKPPRSIFFL